MLNKTLLIDIGYIRANTFRDGTFLSSFVRHLVIFLLKKKMNDFGCSDLNISYDYDMNAVIKHSDFVDFEGWNNLFSEVDISNISRVMEANFINDTVEEFKMCHGTDDNYVLNFNSCLINKSNVVLSSEIFKKEN